VQYASLADNTCDNGLTSCLINNDDAIPLADMARK
jgi:hypothetical protein